LVTTECVVAREVTEKVTELSIVAVADAETATAVGFELVALTGDQAVAFVRASAADFRVLMTLLTVR
jgi:hypothetical protein